MPSGKYPMPITAAARQKAIELNRLIDSAPTPWHAVAQFARRLESAGFTALDESCRWALQPGKRYFVTRGGAALIAFRYPGNSPEVAGYRLLGAHTDSPGLRLKPHVAQAANGLLRLGVEVYGGPILATFADRDLTLAGRVNVRGGEAKNGAEVGFFESRLVHFQRPLLRLPNLAIHMNRAVNEDGLKFNKQTELPLILAGLPMAGEDEAAGECLRELLAGELAVAAADIINWDLLVCDTQPGSLWGAAEEFIANSRLDNLASCHAGLEALLSLEDSASTPLLALFDHEEVGSESAVGAAGCFLSDVLARMGQAAGLDGEGQRVALARSHFASIDMAHAYHPNFPAAHEPEHRLCMNGGPAIKINANQRYSSESPGAARFLLACEAAGVTCQTYVHRSDLACGSTIGPMLAARLGVAGVDIGSPLWAMHSLRESAGVADHDALIRALAAWLRS